MVCIRTSCSTPIDAAKPVAIAPFLRSNSKVVTLGMRASVGDYTDQERSIMLSAPLVFFPTPRFVRIFEAAGIKTFPSGLVYRVRKSRVVQELLFQFLHCPHPRTRIYFGRNKLRTADDFSYPFCAMGPNTAHDRFTVTCTKELEDLAERHNPLIVQEIKEYAERFRLIFVNCECVGVQKRTSTGRGVDRIMPGRLEYVDPAEFSPDIICAVQKVLTSVHLDDIAVEIGLSGQGWQIVALNRPPLSWRSPQGMVNRHHLISRLIENDVF